MSKMSGSWGFPRAFRSRSFGTSKNWRIKKLDHAITKTSNSYFRHRQEQ